MLSLLEAISPTARALLAQRKQIIDDIIRLDDQPPFNTEQKYRDYMATFDDYDLHQYYSAVKGLAGLRKHKTHRK